MRNIRYTNGTIKDAAWRYFAWYVILVYDLFLQDFCCDIAKEDLQENFASTT